MGGEGEEGKTTTYVWSVPATDRYTPISCYNVTDRECVIPEVAAWSRRRLCTGGMRVPRCMLEILKYRAC